MSGVQIGRKNRFDSLSRQLAAQSAGSGLVDLPLVLQRALLAELAGDVGDQIYDGRLQFNAAEAGMGLGGNSAFCAVYSNSSSILRKISV